MPWKDRFIISDRAHLTLNGGLEIDSVSEKKNFLGTTKRGIGPTYADKCMRWNCRMGDLLNWSTFLKKYNHYYDSIEPLYPDIRVNKQEELDQLKPLRDILVENNIIQDTISLVNESLAKGQRVLAEGANAVMLDMDYGNYPFVTSSNTSVGGVITGLGVSHDKIETCLGVVKAYTSRVGEGPLPSRLPGELEEKLREIGDEYGVTTGKARRCGW